MCGRYLCPRVAVRTVVVFSFRIGAIGFHRNCVVRLLGQHGRRRSHLELASHDGPALPALLGVSANTVQGRLRADAPLVRSGLVCVDSDGDLKALDRLNRLAAAPAGSGIDVHRLLLDAAPASEPAWSDFDHVARDRDHVERVIRGALASGARGVNILLYGPPGTGKTEFCKVLAERLDVSLFSVGGFDEKGDEPVRGERLQELRLAQRLLAGHGGSLLLFDEMEDHLMDPFPAWGLFGPRSRMAFRNTGSKVYMHRLLEAAPTPTLWTMNSPRGVSETILRRMMFALELRRPTPGDFAVVHRKAWFLGKHDEPEAVATMLRDECDAKRDRPRPSGFRP